MKIVIALHRPGKGTRSFPEGLVGDDGRHVHTRTKLSTGFRAPWMPAGPRAYVIEKHLFYTEAVAIMELRDANDMLIGHYCDIADGLRREGDRYHLRDLFLDLWVPSGGTPVELDRDEFVAAQKTGLITRQQAQLAESALAKLRAVLTSGDFPAAYFESDSARRGHH